MALWDPLSFSSAALIYLIIIAALSLGSEYISFILPLPDKLIAVTRTSSKGPSLRMTLPKEIAEKLKVSESEHTGFYGVKGEIAVRKIG